MNLLRAIGNLFRFDRANWKAVILCFIAASVFWVFNAFNKNYATNIRFPIRFEYNKEKFVPVRELPHQVNINVSGNGWDLFRSQMGLKSPELSISLEHPLEIKKIVGSSLPPLLYNQLGRLTINYMLTDTLRVSIDEKDFHKFKVAIDDRKFLYKNGFGRISPIVVLPDSVTIEGPKSILHDMPESLTLSISGKQVDQNFSEEIEVVLKDAENIKRNPPLVKVMFEVGNVAVLKKRLKLKKDVTARPLILPDSVSAWFQIPSKRKDEFDLLSNEMSATVDQRKFVKEEWVIPSILKMPAYAELVKIDTVIKK
jgi:YbbR domain-containing protein